MERRYANTKVRLAGLFDIPTGSLTRFVALQAHQRLEFGPKTVARYILLDSITRLGCRAAGSMAPLTIRRTANGEPRFVHLRTLSECAGQRPVSAH